MAAARALCYCSVVIPIRRVLPLVNIADITRRLVSLCGHLIVWLALVSTAAGAVPSPTSEFDSPYQLRVLSDGTVLEVSGSFSWALPQNFQAVLASAPQVRVVRFDSPGGHIQPALMSP